MTKKYNYTDLKEKLRDYICEVVFVKKDGTRRIMKCTLMEEEILARGLTPKGKKQGSKENPVELKEEKEPELPNFIAVVDLESNAWKSFRIDSVVDFDIID